MTTLIVSVSDEQKTMLEQLFQQLHIPFEEYKDTEGPGKTTQGKLDPLALRTIIDYGIHEPESDIRPYTHIDDSADYVRQLRNTDWQ
ncbi:hypothetical protein GCM10023187_32520 [Nibrella viscosa]|uniref:Uncharacterized protein n=1 Tax=Nibrella viscosa TaxID=1084524 RepID=A0ABP8KLC2_9BACT